MDSSTLIWYMIPDQWKHNINLLKTFHFLGKRFHIKWQQKDNVPAKSRKTNWHTFIQITHWPCMCCCHITITTYPLVYKYANMWMKGFFPFSIRELAFGAVQVKTQTASRNSQPELVRTWKHHRKILQLFFLGSFVFNSEVTCKTEKQFSRKYRRMKHFYSDYISRSPDRTTMKWNSRPARFTA